MQLDVLAFGPHPDDLELTCGGTLIALGDQNYSVGVIALTRGELGTLGTPEIRTREFEEATQLMGVAEGTILDIPDGDIQSNRENQLKVIRQIRRHRPKIVLAPYWRDRHPDHERASLLVKEAAFLAGLEKIETDEPPYRPYRVLFYPCRYEFSPSFIVDISDSHERKLKAIQAYKSQFQSSRKEGDIEINISRPEFLEAVVTRAKQYGSYIGTAYGEPFLVREPLRLDDPVKFFGSEYLNSFV